MHRRESEAGKLMPYLAGLPERPPTYLREGGVALLDFPAAGFFSPKNCFFVVPHRKDIYVFL